MYRLSFGPSQLVIASGKRRQMFSIRGRSRDKPGAPVSLESVMAESVLADF
jgi:hypothetical protein